MISADQALRRIFALAPDQSETDTVPLAEAGGRVLAEPVRSERDQPPFAASAMDGFAVRSADAAKGAGLRIIGEAAAGRGCARAPAPGEAVRIFTGAPVPDGVGRIIVQEDTRTENGRLIINADAGSENHIRPKGADFTAGTVIAPPKIITPEVTALIASMNAPEVTVVRRPDVAIIPTGDELRMPGDTLAEHEIVSSSGFGLSAMLKRAGASPRLLPIARDSESSLITVLELAADADLIVTMGGASVGDHDLVVPAARKLGLSLSFHKVAMRPGKPMLAGRLFGKPFIGLPGNPVSAMVCGRVFLVPAIQGMLRLERRPAPRSRAPLAAPVNANGPREHFMRAALQRNGGLSRLKVFSRQDSSLVSVLAEADALAVRPPFDQARQTGEAVEYIDLEFSC